MKRFKIALAVLFVALAGVIAWQALPPSEPVYKGKPLREWLEIYEIVYESYGVNWPGENVRQTAEDAVLHIGTNAIPVLLRFLRVQDSPFKVKLMALAEKQHIFTIHYTPAKTWNSYALSGFSILGTNAQSAVPELTDIAIANRNISPQSQRCAIYALGHVGPRAKVVPTMLHLATNADVRVRISAIDVLRGIDPEAAAKAGITNAP